MLIWYLARGAGISGYTMLSIATGIGAYGARTAPRSERRIVLQYAHRAAAMCGVSLLVIHVVTLLADSYAHVGVLGATVPFMSGYRPAAVTLGLSSMYIIVAVSVTGALRSEFTRSEKAIRIWRMIHLSSYVAWATSAWHFLAVGTDSGQLWARSVLFGGIAIVGTGVITRLAEGRPVRVRQVAPKVVAR